MENIKIYGSEEFLKKIENKKPTFLCALASTETAEIEGITCAGASSKLMKYTPPADAELIQVGVPLSLPEIPQTPGATAPTPGIITKATLKLAKIPFLAINTGCEITPQMPYIELGGKPGKDIRTGKAVENPEEIYNNAKLFSETYSKITEHIIIGESTPAGTTTALGVLTALGYNVKNKLSGTLVENPHELKNKVVTEGLKNSGLTIGELESPFDAVKALGDPMIPALAGIVMGSQVPVTLAGGTQMTAVCALIKAINPDFDFSNICIATTIYVAEDETSNIHDIISQIGDITLFASNPHFEESTNEGLKTYANGSAKEGVGAGGAIMAALLQGITVEEIREEVESILENF
jgi:uncharacterized protein (TIGR00303 family)